MSDEGEKKPDPEEEEEEDEEDLEKLQAEIARMEAEAARITKETEELEKKKDAKIAAAGGGAAKAGVEKDQATRDGYVIASLPQPKVIGIRVPVDRVE
jgi:Zn-dependent M16 (insulinase) family peptidase